jgi:hypothetical protein
MEKEGNMGLGRAGSSGAVVEIHIRGTVSEAFRQEFSELASGMVAVVEPGETVLYGRVADQAELYGVLDRIQGLGLELLEVRRTLPEG